MNKVQLTQDGYKKLEAELKELVESKRPNAVERLSKARSMGDLKENSEYHAAKEELAFVEGRATEIETLLKSAEVIKEESAPNVVSLGKKIKIETGGDQIEYTIVGEYEVDISKKQISS